MVSAPDLISLLDRATVRLVVLMACRSESIGRYLVEEGVPHVIAISKDTDVHDTASALFTKQLYLYLLVRGRAARNGIARSCACGQPGASAHTHVLAVRKTYVAVA